jgi:hypothetical protein
MGIFTLFSLADGKIAEEREIFEELGLMTQLVMELEPKQQVHQYQPSWTNALGPLER